MTEFYDFIIDIQEQYPLLSLEETIVIATELGIKYPTDPKKWKELFYIA
ncbi:TnsA endonuclease N-terminal domain-containing protein [Bacillus sp. DN_7.5]|nr:MULTISPECIES: TnsA endonuclease N-terminal domain-containing protein [Bacillus]MCT4481608.1 TnsA endonuclease N-terminal domain-containing protein [Bacillus sp. DN_7.5]MCX2464377.1 TnsA endonuclease N-terminal domain-containing protein [Bacillus sp. AM01]MCP1138412.1 TnsA endonuclease N-terminal domain-containing protein [Bacillus cereus]MCT6909422.1 TnsA endonuclease N-terminal domain-containing protein [Bacillus cereus]MDF9574857.1 TnsA endonuclease N-terminal domain-containing protein [B